MKAATASRSLSSAPAYPNAADRRYYLRRLLDGLLAVATAVGAVTVLIFLMLL